MATCSKCGEVYLTEHGHLCSTRAMADNPLSGLASLTMLMEQSTARLQEIHRLTARLEAAERDAARYRFGTTHGWPKPTRALDGSRLWYMDRACDHVEIVHPNFHICIDKCMEQPAADGEKQS